MTARTETILFSITAMLFAGILLSGVTDLVLRQARPGAEMQAVQSWGVGTGTPVPETSARREASSPQA